MSRGGVGARAEAARGRPALLVSYSVRLSEVFISVGRQASNSGWGTGAHDGFGGRNPLRNRRPRVALGGVASNGRTDAARLDPGI